MVIPGPLYFHMNFKISLSISDIYLLYFHRDYAECTNQFWEEFCIDSIEYFKYEHDFNNES